MQALSDTKQAVVKAFRWCACTTCNYCTFNCIKKWLL